MREFDGWLVEAPLRVLEEAIAEARRALASKSLEFLHECKARVDRRLDARPERKVFSFDPRISCWYDIADALEEEINFRSGKSPKSKAEHPDAQNGASTAQITGNKTAKTAASTLTHASDYRSVTLGGKRYELTPRQAQMIAILHTACTNGHPDVAVAHILEKLETPNGRWQDTWKTSPEARKALITTGERKGTLRLNA